MPVIVSVLRQLLDGADSAAPASPLVPAERFRLQAAQVAPSSATPKPPRAKSVPPAPPPDGSWAELRQRVRAARAERGIGNAQLAQEIGAAKMTVTKAVSSNRSPTKAMRAKLEAWLAGPAQAPEVAATAAAAFRPNGHHAAYVGAANGAGAGTTDGV